MDEVEMEEQINGGRNKDLMHFQHASNLSESRWSSIQSVGKKKASYCLFYYNNCTITLPDAEVVK